jgi:DNA-binding CsgD family transcriptional regulator
VSNPDRCSDELIVQQQEAEEDKKEREDDLLKKILSLCTQREKEILGFIEEGLSQDQIANVFDVTKQAVSQSVRNVRKKIGGQHDSDFRSYFTNHKQRS